MADSAKVTSVEAVAAFLAHLRQFQDEAGDILSAHGQSLQRFLEWFAHDVPFYWKEQTRRRYEEVSQTRAAYEGCKLRRVAGQRPSCFEEQKAYQHAKRRLRTAQEKGEVLRRWNATLTEEAEECRGRLGKFQYVLDVELEKTIALVERMLGSLEAYLGRSVDEPDEAAGGETSAAPPSVDAGSGDNTVESAGDNS